MHLKGLSEIQGYNGKMKFLLTNGVFFANQLYESLGILVLSKYVRRFFEDKVSIYLYSLRDLIEYYGKTIKEVQKLCDFFNMLLSDNYKPIRKELGLLAYRSMILNVSASFKSIQNYCPKTIKKEL